MSYTLTDGHGMYLEVPHGSKYRRLKYRADGKERQAALGVYLTISGACSARRGRELKDALRAGFDPSTEKSGQSSHGSGADIEERTVADAFEE